MTSILTFHRVTNGKFLEYEDISTQNLNFILSKIHSKCISFNDIILNNFNNNFLLSFDDGFSSDYEIVLPLMIKYNVKGIFFITTKFIGQKNYLNWDQIKLLSEKGMEIGSHSVNHKDMLSLSKKERLYELNESKTLIENRINKEITTFSFPFGRCDSKIISEVFYSGYKYCFTSKPGRLSPNKNIIPRISINGSMSKDQLKRILNNDKINFYKTVFLYNIREYVKLLLGIKYYWILRKYLQHNFLFKLYK